MEDSVQERQAPAIGSSSVRVRPYILAGGMSSRMGTDKAMLMLAGRTLLGRAVDMLRAVPVLHRIGPEVLVTIVGARTSLEGADRVIADSYSKCGPLGGIEAALRDLDTNGGAEWALFTPVDMPFLPAGLIDALLREWIEAARSGARLCWVEVDGIIQPLISMVHRSLHSQTVEALTAGRFKVTPVLQSAAEVLASSNKSRLGLPQVVHTTVVDVTDLSPAAGWIADPDQERLKRLWFSNLNSEGEFREAETFLAHPG